MRYRFSWRWGRGKVLIDKVESPPREQKVEAKQVQVIKKKTIKIRRKIFMEVKRK